ncbi:hypothetical protein AWM68_02115 [Fictibacillus phosphorivorans]|uniref:Uncharacterized protein n=1 Tax=Fictibacillus phosphorivorans TaxID=1221500 RepID=A0A165P5W9_9BACL|nr:hypothetical protein AWM68_02115 [Fictibacillus phosphorivorans]
MCGGAFIFTRKIIVANFTSIIMTIFNATILGMELGLFIGMYLFPLVNFYGCLSSMVSDFLTKRIHGLPRFFIAGVIHLFFATSILIYTLITEYTNDITIRKIINDIFLMQPIMSAVIFWLLDELFRKRKVRSKCRNLLNKLGELRI